MLTAPSVVAALSRSRCGRCPGADCVALIQDDVTGGGVGHAFAPDEGEVSSGFGVGDWDQGDTVGQVAQAEARDERTYLKRCDESKLGVVLAHLPAAGRAPSESGEHMQEPAVTSGAWWLDRTVVIEQLGGSDMVGAGDGPSLQVGRSGRRNRHHHNAPLPRITRFTTRCRRSNNFTRR